MRLTSVSFFVDFLLLSIASFIFFSPYFVMPSLIYPVRVDSLYVENEQLKSTMNEAANGSSAGAFVYNPGSLNLTYSNFDVTTKDGLILRGWYIPVQDSEAYTVLIIHDINESKITNLETVKALHDRGFNVCIVDMRAHGNSDGESFSLGNTAVEDVRVILDSLYTMPASRRIAVFGIGTGAVVGIELTVLDNRPSVLIAQSPFDSFERYVRIFARKQWKSFDKFLLPSLKFKLKNQLGYDISELNVQDIIRYDSIPTLFIAGSNDKTVDLHETRTLFDSSAARNKNFMTVRDAGHQEIEEKGSESYYNEIMAFINQNMPRKVKTARNKKLAWLIDN